MLSILSDLAQSLSEWYEPLHEDLPGKEICSSETEEWRLAFNWSSTPRGGSAGVVLYASDGTDISLAFKLDFLCTNNEATYEALVIELISFKNGS